MKKIVIGIILLLVVGIILYPYYLLNDFQEKLNKEEVDIAQLIDKEQLHQSIKEDFARALRVFVNKYPAEGNNGRSFDRYNGARAFTRIIVDSENFPLLLKGRELVELADKTKKEAAEKANASESSYWAYFTGLNQYRVSAEHMNFDFQYKGGGWLLTGVSFDLDMESSSDKARLTRRQQQSFEPRLVEPKYVKPHFLVKDMKQPERILNYMNNGFFAGSRYNGNELQIQTNFSFLPLEIDYNANWHSVVMADGSNGVELTEESEQRADIWGRSTKQFNSFGSSWVHLKPGVEYTDIRYIKGEVTYLLPTHWEVFEFELPAIGFSQTREDINVSMTQAGQNKVDLDFSIPSSLPNGGTIKVEVFDKEGRQLKVESKGLQSQADDRTRTGSMSLEYYGQAKSAKAYIVTKVEKHTESVRAHAGLDFEIVRKLGLSLDDLEGRISASRYKHMESNQFSEPIEITNTDNLKKKMEVVGIERNPSGEVAISLVMPEYANGFSAELDTSNLKATDDNGQELEIHYEKTVYPHWIVLSGVAKDDRVIEKLSGELTIEYPTAFDNNIYSPADSIDGIKWYKHGVSVENDVLDKFHFIKAYDKTGLGLAWLLNAPSKVKTNATELGFWGEVSKISVSTVKRWYTLTFDLSDVEILEANEGKQDSF